MNKGVYCLTLAALFSLSALLRKKLLDLAADPSDALTALSIRFRRHCLRHCAGRYARDHVPSLT